MVSPVDIANREIVRYRRQARLEGPVRSLTVNLLFNVQTAPDYPTYRSCPLPAYAHAEVRRLSLRNLRSFVGSLSRHFVTESGARPVRLLLVPSSRVMIHQRVRADNIPGFYAIAERVIILIQRFYDAQYQINAAKVISGGSKLAINRVFRPPATLDLIIKLRGF